MSIQSSEIIWRRSAVVGDGGTNGGRMTATPIVTGVKNNIFPDVPQSERAAGSTKYRKVFIHIANDADLALVAPKIYVESRTPGDDSVTLIPGTQRNVQSGITGSEQKYGAGVLNATVSSGVGSIVVAVEDAADNLFPNGMVIRISDRASINAAGNEEFVVVSSNSYSGNLCTIGFSPNLGNGYTNTVTKVASVYEPGDIATSTTGWVLTSAAGTYNTGTYPIVGDSIGTIDQDWTVTFTSPTAFTIAGDTVGAVGSYNTSGDSSPVNADYSKPYFTLKALGFGGTWVSGNTITFTTHPAAVPVWYKRVVPVAANSISGNSVIVGIDGESA